MIAIWAGVIRERAHVSVSTRSVSEHQPAAAIPRVQVSCQGDVRVIKRSGFWGQDDQVLPDLPAADSSYAASVAPLGQLEFVLDRRRQRNTQR